MILVLATHNLHKASEMMEILSARFPALEIRTLRDYPTVPEPEETGHTYAANAIIKAEHAAELTGEWCLADDAGLEVNALDGAPGIYSRRFAGEETPFTEKMQIILGKLHDADDRGARFRCCVALAKKGCTTEVYEATCEGQIAMRPSGNGGFGYDPIFFLPDHGCTMADLTAAQKHEISHRGAVLKMFGDAFAHRAV